MKNTSSNPHPSRPDEPVFLSALGAAEQVLARTGELQEHFREDLDWMGLRRQAWRTRTWRVGLIGITSAGKSTLVNALLGQKLLPSAVRPSSNTLVVCRRGAEHEILVHYLDGRVERIRNAQAEPGARLAQLCDEKTNPDNQLGVKEIEVFSPTFRLGEDVALVDTPGLDATDAHERLTLVEFLPTVDMVVFLTTAKANSDGAISGYMKRIADEGKPLVLVQNMIDAIEPKLGMGGTIQRSRAEVAGDHLQRLQRLVKSTLGEAGAAVPILQVSALEALRGQESASNIPELVGTIERHLLALEPALVSGRCQQLAKHLQRIIQREGKSTELVPGGNYARDEQSALTTAGLRLDALRERFRGEMETLLMRAGHSAHGFQQEMSELRERDVKGAQQLVERLQDWRTQTAESVIEAFDKSTRALHGLARDLNLRPEDYILTAPRHASHRTLHVPTEQKSSTVRKEKKGFVAAVFRFFDSEAGYEVETRWRDVVDLKSLQSKVNAATTAEVEWLQESDRRLQASVLERQEELREELARRRRSLERHLHSVAKGEERQRAAAALVPLQSRLDAEFQKLHARSTPVTARGGIRDASIGREAEPHVVALLALAQQISRRRFLAAREHCLERVGQRHPEARHRVLLWAWDADLLGRFVQRFWSDLLPPVREEFTGALRVGVPPHSTQEALLCVHAEGRTSEDELRRSTDAFLKKPATTFLLIDVEQPGAALRMLRRSPLVNSLHRTQGLILVPQSLRGVLNSQSLAEALLELRHLAESFPLRVDGLLANHDSVALSHMADRLFLEGQHLRTLADEQRWLAELQGATLPAGFEAAPILRAWREAMTSSSTP